MTQQQKIDAKTLGRWTKEEHQKFLLGLQLYGKDWKKIEDFIGTRNGAQIRSHAQKFFLRMKKQFQFEPTSEKDNIEPQAPIQNNSVGNFVQQSQESNNQYSYFVQKIVKKSHEQQKFDFWQAFVDQRGCQELNQIETGISKRKSSFIFCDQLETQIKTHKQPTKKIKTK